ncbi:MAG: hypothetical protein ACRYFS_11710 [Janthinobacterium lividum]
MAFSAQSPSLTIGGGSVTLPAPHGSNPGASLSFSIPASSLPNGNWLECQVYGTSGTYIDNSGNTQTVTGNVGFEYGTKSGLDYGGGNTTATNYINAAPYDIDALTGNTTISGGGNFLTPVAYNTISGIQMVLTGLPVAQCHADPSKQNNAATSSATSYSCPGKSLAFGWSVIGNALSCVSSSGAAVAFTQGTTFQANNFQFVAAQSTPDVSDTYTLTVEGPGGDIVTSTCSITAVPLSVTLSVTPASNGNPPLLTWTSNGAGGIYIRMQYPGSSSVQSLYYSSVDPQGRLELYANSAVSVANYVDSGNSLPLSGSGDLTQILQGDTTFQNINFIVDAYEKSYPPPSNQHSTATSGYFPCTVQPNQTPITRTATATLTVGTPQDSSAARLKVTIGRSLSGPAIPPASTQASASTSFFLNTDGPHRPLAAKADALSSSTALGYYSNDAGHSFLSGVIDNDPTCADISLLVDRARNRFLAVYSKGASGSTALYSAAGPITDGFTPDVAPAAISGITGSYSIGAQSDTNRLLYTLAYLSGGNLVCAESGDGGQNWQVQGTLASGVDFTSSGRPGLTFLKEAVFAAWSSGNTLETAMSIDGGMNWTPPITAASAGPYSGVSLLGWLGMLYLLAFSGSPAVPVLLMSETLGSAWTLSTGTLPAGLSAPSCIGVLPESSQLRLGLGYHSLDDGQIWLAN